jgi:hypothetical protein
MRAGWGLTVAALVLLGLAGCGGRPPAKYYYYPAWGFSAAFNAPPKVTETPAGPDAPHNLTLVEDAGADDFAVYAAEFPPATRRDLDQLADTAAATIAKTMGAEVGTATYAATVQLKNQATGREFTLTKGGHPFVTVRIYLVGDHYYEIAGRTSFGPDDPAAKAFLDSFTIIGGPPTGAADSAATNGN